MLETIRRLTQNPTVLVVFGAIIFVFIFFFGPQTSGIGASGRRWVGKAEGTTVWQSQLNAAYGRLQARSGERRRGGDPAEVARTRRELVDSMLTMLWLARRGEEAGLAVGRNEVRCYIANWNRRYLHEGEAICGDQPEGIDLRFPNPDFGFYADFEQPERIGRDYRADVMANFALSIDEFEWWKGRELLARKYLEVLQQTVVVPRAMVEATWRRRNDSVELEYIRLDPERFAAPAVTDIEIDRALESRRDEVAQLWTDDPSAWSQPAQLRLRRIFLRRPAEDDAGYADAEAAYLALLERARGGEDFEALAREYSELDSEKSQGGDMGLRSRDTLSAALWDAASALEVGGVDGLQQASNWSIFQVEENLPARTQPLEEVEREVARQLLQRESTGTVAEGLRARGERILALVAEGMDLQAAADAERESLLATLEEGASPPPVLPVNATGTFTRERAPSNLASLGPEYAAIILPADPPDQIPGIGTSRALARLAFELSEERPAPEGLVEVDGIPFVIRLRTRSVATEPDDAALAVLEQDLRREMVTSWIGPEQFLTQIFAGVPRSTTSALLAAVREQARPTFRIREADFVVDPVNELVR
jgi:parvulin-like peptidyl-prolyl isomerase